MTFGVCSFIHYAEYLAASLICSYEILKPLRVLFYLHRDRVSDASRQDVEHFHVAAQQAHRVGTRMDFSVCVFVAEGVDDVHHYSRRVRHSMGLSVCWLTHFVSLHCAVKN